MPKNNFYKQTIQDYNKSLNKIMVLGLTGMAALGTSMLIMESTKTNASIIAKTYTHSSNTKTTLKLPTLKPQNHSNTPNSLVNPLEENQQNSPQTDSIKNKCKIITIPT